MWLLLSIKRTIAAQDTNSIKNVLFLHDENAQCLALLEEMNAIFWNRME
jgi:hypothetical protein